ncbi:potassium channel family protein [Streptomyces sp. ST2-7A]|uniref:potassium channel family protein n=1 Tax=Streptomyces sp. ST2-7A TaxID=2907214 RepID=UPI001F372544|nr:potassium channel family protein [Streptomyces sp. ST2-7A]MCE7083175.1 ion channel [Streptomyces sp. ST2-7A]
MRRVPHRGPSSDSPDSPGPGSAPGAAPPSPGRTAPVHPNARFRDLALLLLVVAALQFGYPISLYGPVWNAFYMVLYAGMIVFGLRTVRTEGPWVRPVVGVAIVFSCFAVWSVVDRQDTAAALGRHLSVALFQLALIASLVLFVFRRHHRPGPELILAAISVYLLLGAFFAACFTAMELSAPGSFTDLASPDTAIDWSLLMYFGFVTLATVGYGDVVPLTPWAQSLAAMQAVVATLFLTTVIARLVGVYTMSPRRNDGDGDAAPGGTVTRDAPTP